MFVVTRNVFVVTRNVFVVTRNVFVVTRNKFTRNVVTRNVCVCVCVCVWSREISVVTRKSVFYFST